MLRMLPKPCARPYSVSRFAWMMLSSFFCCAAVASCVASSKRRASENQRHSWLTRTAVVARRVSIIIILRSVSAMRYESARRANDGVLSGELTQVVLANVNAKAGAGQRVAAPAGPYRQVFGGQVAPEQEQVVRTLVVSEA